MYPLPQEACVVQVVHDDVHGKLRAIEGLRCTGVGSVRLQNVTYINFQAALKLSRNISFLQHIMFLL